MEFFLVTRSMAKYVEVGATTRFFNCFIGIDKQHNPNSPQSIAELVDDQNDINVVPEFATDDFDHVTDTDETIQEAIANDEDVTESHEAPDRGPGKENRQPITFDNKKTAGKKPFQ